MLNRRGFTLIELAIAMALIALLAGVLIPTMFRRSQDAQSTAMLQNLNALTIALNAFKADVGRYPSRLTMLSTAPVAASVDICSRTMPLFGSWNGPYMDRTLTATGLPTGSATITDTVTRDPPSAVITIAPAQVILTAREVDQDVALALDAQFDGDANLTTGSIRWSVGALAGRGSLFYRFPMRGC